MSEQATSRIPHAELRRVTASDIDRAIAKLVAGYVETNFSESRDFDVLLDDGTRLPPKKVFGLAIEEVLGFKAKPSHFSAGVGTPCFQLIEEAGYKIVDKEKLTDTNSSAGDGADKDNAEWTDEELAACLLAYLHMLGKQSRGMKLNKSAYRRSLMAGALKGRSAGSIEYRMQNISAFFALKSMPLVNGYLPAKNLGRGVLDRLEKAFIALGEPDSSEFAPTVDADNPNKRSKRVAFGPSVFSPVGNIKPAKAASSGTQFLRDPLVIDYVLGVAGGHCELCETKAPFMRSDGTPFLEVHHVKFLADGGPDTVCNAAALCPNCHRACHHSTERETLKRRILRKVKRLVEY